MNLNQVSPLLSPQQIGELASNLDAIHTRALKAIERLNQDVASRKADIANRWKSAGIDADAWQAMSNEYEGNREHASLNRG